ncbi:hypothetical protein HDV00_010627 [Rhizophlyctis rosea]|nr:hypothetical protein HDV00_010627 [Rhizophlyctis rosea]
MGRVLSASAVAAAIIGLAVAQENKPDLTVYQQNALASGWENWSWSTDYDFAYAGPPTVPASLGTTAIKATTGAWAGISFRNAAGYAGYNTMVFYVVGNAPSYSLHFQSTVDNADVTAGSLNDLCKGPITSDGFVQCFADLSKAGDHPFDRLTLQAGTDQTQTVYFADMYFTMKTVLDLTDTHSFSAGAAIGSRTLILLGTGDPAAVQVSRVDKNKLKDVGVKSYTNVTDDPVNHAYFTLKDWFKPGDYIIHHNNGIIKFTIPEPLVAKLKNAKGTHKISPDIYDVNFPPTADYLHKSGVTLGRWGGNTMSTYNPSNDWINAAADWYFESRLSNEGGIKSWIDTIIAAGGAKSVVTVPMLDWVSKNVSCHSYSVAKYGAQQQVDPYNSDAGNGILTNGSRIINDPSDCYEPWTSAKANAWLKSWTSERKSKVQYWELDNEFDIADGTHVDVHPQRQSYDEELAKMTEYGLAVRDAGPTSCCFWFYYHSGAGDADMAAHNNTSKLRYVLRGLSHASKTHKKRILTHLDLHFSDSGTGEAASRLRGTRSWWDPTYVSESWMGQASSWPPNEDNKGVIMWIPRMRKMIADEYPGLGLGTTEWYGDDDLPGGLVIADTLGIFARENLDFATKWANVDDGKPGFAAFWLFRGGNPSASPFPDTYINIQIFYDPNLAGVYVANKGPKYAAVFVNKDPVKYQNYRIEGLESGQFTLRHFGRPATGAAEGARFTTTIPLDGSTNVVVPPYSAIFVMKQ